MVDKSAITADPEGIRSELAEAVEALNAETDPGQRIGLYGDIEGLRAQLRKAEGSK